MNRSVWSIVRPDETDYVMRCSFCGKFGQELRRHWFFTGLYCLNCIRIVLYGDVPMPYYSIEHGYTDKGN